MLRKVFATFGLFAALFALVIAPAQASVTYDPATGGFAGKGDVKNALGVSEATMTVSYAEGLNFTYVVTQDFSFDCEWDTGVKNVTHHVKPGTATLTVSDSVSTEVRKNGNLVVTGFILSGVNTDGVVPGPVDSDCGAVGNEMKTIVPGTIVPGEVTGGGLFVNGVPLPITPPV